MALGVGATAGLLYAQGSAKITFLAVGQGDCTVIQQGDTAILVDVGPKSREGFDAGSRIVLPRLRALGVTNVPLIFITHPDGDHIGGLRAVFHRYSSSQIAISAAFKEHAELKAWLKGAGVPMDKVIWLSGRSRARIGVVDWDIAAPPWMPGQNDNDGSLFIRVSQGASSAILTGDASIAVEETFGKKLSWSGQILKAGHHGSRTSTGIAWISQVRPEWCVISCGLENAYGHPHPSVLEDLIRSKVEILRTDIDGELSFSFTDSGFKGTYGPSRVGAKNLQVIRKSR